MDQDDHRREAALLRAEFDAVSRLAAGQGLQTTLDILLSQIEQLAGHGCMASVRLTTENGQSVSFCSGPRLPEGYRTVINRTALSSALDADDAPTPADRAAIPADRASGDKSGVIHPLLYAAGIRSVTSIPVVSSVNHLLGTLTIYYPASSLHADRPLLNRVALGLALLIERHRTEHAVHDRRDYLQLLTDTVPALLAYIDADRRYRFCNQHYSDWFGLSPDDIRGRSVSEIWGPEAWRVIGPLIDAALRGDAVEHEAAVNDRGGSLRWVHARYTPHRNGHGHVVGVVAMISESTSHKRKQQSLSESAERFGRLLEVGAAMVWTADASGTPREDAPSWRAFIGYRLDQYVHSWQWLEAYHPDDRPRLTEAWAEALEARRPYECQARVRHADGHYRHIVSRALPLLNADGSVRQWIGIKVDVTRQKEAEAALSESERMLREAADAAQAVAWDMDMSTGFVRCKGQAHTIWGLSEGSAEHYFSRVHPDDRERVRRQSEDTMTAGGSMSAEYRVIDPLERTRWLYSRGTVVQGSEGQPVRFIGVSVDITERKRAEAASDESRQRYANLVNSLDGIVWEADVKTMTFTFVSAQAERMLGYPVEAWYDPTFWLSHIHPEDRDYAIQFCAEETKARRDHLFEYRMIAADGRTVWLRDIISVVVEHDEPVLLRGIMVDVTHRKQAEEEIAALHAEGRRTLEELQALMHVLPVGIFVSRDRSCSTITMNAAGAAMLRIPEGTNASKTGPEADRLPFRVLQGGLEMPPDQLPMQRAAATGVPVIAEEVDVVFEDGAVRNLYEYALPLFDETGAVRGSVGVFVDFTDRKRAEEALRLSEERFRLATTAGKVGVWEWDIRANAVTWTESLYRLHGVPLGTRMTADDFSSLVHPLDRDRVFNAIDATLRTDAPYELEFRSLRPDGDVVWLFTNAVVLREGTVPIRMIGATVDITASKRTAEDLQSWNAALERRVEARTHELTQSQQHLRALATELNLAEQRERKRVATELHDHLAQLLVLSRLKIGQAKRVGGSHPAFDTLVAQSEEVINEALTYTRTLVADLSPPILHEFGLTAALAWLAEYMRRYDLAVTVVMDGDEEAALPEDQAVLLFQSVRELLMNAHKHAHSTEATVTVSRQDQTLRIVVQDQGQGFDPSAVFSESAAHAVPVLHFGLFSIRERMHALGGAFDIQSRPGQGTTAILTVALLPPPARDERDPPCVTRDGLLEETVSSAPDGASRITDRASRPVIRVLLVDDHAMMRQGLRSVLETYADLHVVGEASNGEEAVAQVERLNPSVVVMDINMPRMNGIEATARIKSRFPKTIVIGLSVNAAGGNHEAMKAAGASLLLTKESAVEQLHESIRQALTHPVPPIR